MLGFVVQDTEIAGLKIEQIDISENNLLYL